jgi:hypothetical protein
MAKYEVKFWVLIKSTSIATVEADSKKEAIEKIEEGNYLDIEENIGEEVEDIGSYEVELLEEGDLC